MIIIGLAFIIYWKQKHKVKPIIFAWGGLLWFIAIIVKGIIDLLLNPVYSGLNAISTTALLIIGSLIIGLRTGLIESGISYFMIKGRLKKLNWNKAISLGIGFGATESIVLGTLSLITLLAVFNPTILSQLTEEELTTIQALFDQDTIIILASWIERAFTTLVHIFTMALIIKSLETKNLKYLWISIGFKSMLDFPIPFFQTIIVNGGITTTFLVELYIITMGVLSLYGLKWVKTHKFKK